MRRLIKSRFLSFLGFVATSSTLVLGFGSPGWADLAENPQSGDVAASTPGKLQIFGPAIEPKVLKTEASQGALLYSADGRILVLNEYNSAHTQVLDGEALRTLTHASPAFNRVLSPDGKLLAVVLSQGQVELFSLSDFRSLATIATTSTQGICNIQFSADSKSLITYGEVGRESQIEHWDASGKSLGSVLAKATWHKVRLVGEGAYLLADSGKEVALAKLADTPKVIRQFPGWGLCDTSADGKLAALGKGHDVQVVGIPDGALQLQLGSVAQGEGRYPIPRLEFGSGGQFVTFWTTKSTTQIWSVPARRRLFNFARQAYVVFSAAKDLAGILENGYVDVVDLTSGKVLSRLDAPVKSPGQNEAQACLLTRDGRRAFVQWSPDNVQRVDLPSLPNPTLAPPVPQGGL